MNGEHNSPYISDQEQRGRKLFEYIFSPETLQDVVKDPRRVEQSLTAEDKRILAGFLRHFFTAINQIYSNDGDAHSFRDGLVEYHGKMLGMAYFNLFGILSEELKDDVPVIKTDDGEALH